MGLLNLPLVVLLCWVFYLLSFIALCEDSVVTVKFLKAPHAFSHLNSATFAFEVLVGGNGACTNSNITCKLDDGIASNCEGRTVLYAGLQDGNHTFEVCTNGSQGVGCGIYKWTVDTIPPTAYITTSTPFTNAMNVSINISFSEPCTRPTGGGSFVCSSVNDCNLLVYGSGQVIPSSLNILQPNLQYSVLVGLSSTAQYGRVILVMDKNFCTDSAGNKFTRNQNYTFNVHFDRRSMFVNFTTHVPERLLQLNGETRLVRATNNCIKLRMCLTFPEPVLNSSAEILNSIKVQILYALQLNQGTLLPLAVSKQHPGHRRFEYKAATCISGMAIVTVNINSTIICISGTPVSQVEPITFIYDSLRPTVTLSTPRSESLRPTVILSTPSHIRTRERNIPMLIKFVKPVFGVNSSIISITGGHIQSFKEISSRIYAVEIKAENDSIYCVSVFVPENVIGDVAGNKNLRSNDLQLCPYHVPKISCVVSVLATASFVVTSIAAGLLTVSIASLSSIGTFSTPFSSFSNPASNLFRSACHIQVFALSRWLAVRLPVNYYEFARGLQWSIPYFSLPWETGHIQPVVLGSSPPTNPDSYRSKIHDSGIFLGVQPKQENLSRVASVYKARLRPNPKEYISYFQNNSKPDAEYILDGWEDFSRTMFWLAIIGGSLILLHALLLAILKFRKQQQRGYGLLTFPRFEIFLVNLALPSICETSAALIRGGTPLEFVVGTLLLGTVYFLLLALLWFLSTSITFAKLLQYNEDLQVGRIFNNPRNRGQWTSKIEQNSDSLTILGPLFEDIRGPMLSQKIYGESIDTHGDGIIASNEEIEELCPKDEEVSGDNVERIPGTRLNSAPQSSVQNTSCSTIPSHIPSKRSDTAATLIDSLTFSTSLHTHGDDGIIASNDETEDLCPKDEEVSRDNVARTLDSAPRSSVRSTSSSTKPSHIPSKRSNTAATLVDSLTSSISFHTHDLCQKAEEVSRDNVVRTSGTRLDSAPRSSMQNTSHSTTPSHIPSKRSDTTATLVDSLTTSTGFHSHGDDGIIASDDKTEDLCPKAEEVFQENVVRTPGTTLNSTPQSSVRNTSRSTTPCHIPSKRSNTAATLIDSLTSNTSFHTHGNDGIIASNNKTEDLCPKAKEVSGENVVRTLGTRLDLAPQSSVQSTSHSSRPSNIPSKRSDTAATLVDSFTPSTSFLALGDDGFIAFDDETRDLCPKAEEVFGDNVVRTSGMRLDSTPPSLARSMSHSTQLSRIPSTRSRTATTLVDSLTSKTSVNTHGDDGIIAIDGETEELSGKVEKVSGGSVVKTLGTRLASAPPSSAQSTSRSTQPSTIPFTRSHTAPTLAGSLTSGSSVHPHGDDGIIASDDKTEEVYPKAEDLELFGGIVHTNSEAPFNQKLFGNSDYTTHCSSP
ncbi:hypothetical protein ACB092_04G171300 [Castanea dentata]